MTATVTRTPPTSWTSSRSASPWSRSCRTGPGRLADVPSFDRGIGGAESNVACALAGAGHTAKWISRVGADGFGDHLVAAIAAYGVDTSRTSGATRTRPTGIYFRTAGGPAPPTRTRSPYYRRRVAPALAMSAVDASDPGGGAALAGRILHLSGHHGGAVRGLPRP